MALEFQKGQTVTLSHYVIPTGPVINFKVDSDGNVSYLVQWEDDEGDLNFRWFSEDELKAV